MALRHIDLFSGIGGFAYAADQVWGDVEHVFCDNDKFCQQVLKKHWPESKVYDDIRNITDAELKGLEGWGVTGENTPEVISRQKSAFGITGYLRDVSDITIVTGGFPCQPFSAAGLRKGTADTRHLWPEMLRVIQLAEPEWIIAENVRGLLTWNNGIQFEQVCLDLESACYEVQPFVIPAVAVNAPHRRDRVWFVAHRTSSRRKWQRPTSQVKNGKTKSRTGRQLAIRPEGQDSDAKNSIGQRSQRWDGRYNQSEKWSLQDEGSSWNRNWPEVAAELCSVDDGFSVELDGLKLTKAQHRAAQIKAYGNAIVPQVAMQIMLGIKESTGTAL